MAEAVWRIAFAGPNVVARSLLRSMYDNIRPTYAQYVALSDLGDFGPSVGLAGLFFRQCFQLLLQRGLGGSASVPLPMDGVVAAMVASTLFSPLFSSFPGGMCPSAGRRRRRRRALLSSPRPHQALTGSIELQRALSH